MYECISDEYHNFAKNLEAIKINFSFQKKRYNLIINT